ncbi:hypothetical protein MYU51_019581 [Penicillium brevicompactum]
MCSYDCSVHPTDINEDNDITGIGCILSMSDVQIITGISIIVSGAAQLKCGISTHQWQVLVYLAWFSSLTHLSCLTLLRNCLHQRPAERIWRLVFSFGVFSVCSAPCVSANREDIEWSFGQVMSIALLAVPLVTVFEFFYPESKTQKVEERQGQMCSVSVDRSEVISEFRPTASSPYRFRKIWLVGSSMTILTTSFTTHPALWSLQL